MSDGEAAGDFLADGAEVSAHPLAQWFQRFEAGATPGRVDADALGIMMVNGYEHGDMSLPGPGRGHVGAPKRVDAIRNDGAVVVAWSARSAPPAGRQQVVLAHQPQYPAQRG